MFKKLMGPGQFGRRSLPLKRVKDSLVSLQLCLTKNRSKSGDRDIHKNVQAHCDFCLGEFIDPASLGDGIRLPSPCDPSLSFSSLNSNQACPDSPLSGHCEVNC